MIRIQHFRETPDKAGPLGLPVRKAALPLVGVESGSWDAGQGKCREQPGIPSQTEKSQVLGGQGRLPVSLWFC